MVENLIEKLRGMIRDLERLEDRESSKEEETCAHRFEECDGLWTCMKCCIVDDSRMCFLHYADEGTTSRVHFREDRPEKEVEPPGLAEGETVPTTLRELRKLGARSGIKYSSHMNSEELCSKLSTPPVKGRPRKPVAIILTDRGTGEVLRFPSISKTAKHLGINPGSVAYRIKNAGSVESGGRTFTVGKEE